VRWSRLLIAVSLSAVESTKIDTRSAAKNFAFALFVLSQANRMPEKMGVVSVLNQRIKFGLQAQGGAARELFWCIGLSWHQNAAICIA
jgi:hypothetical protein